MSKYCSTSEETSIIHTILSDVNAIIPNFFTLAEGYRLLVGAAEEINQMPNTPFEIFERAIIRCDRTGTLIDILLELLCCKIKFSSEFLSVSCAPVDIIEKLSNCDRYSHQTAEKIVLIEAMRRLLENIDTHGSCFSPPPPIKKPSPPKPPPVQTTPLSSMPPENFPPDLIPGKELSNEIFTDIETESQAALATEANFSYLSGRSAHQKYGSPLSRKHI